VLPKKREIGFHVRENGGTYRTRSRSAFRKSGNRQSKNS
jgi:hypothetical protein